MPVVVMCCAAAVIGWVPPPTSGCCGCTASSKVPWVVSRCCLLPAAFSQCTAPRRLASGKHTTLFRPPSSANHCHHAALPPQHTHHPHRQLTRVHSRGYLCDKLTSSSACSGQAGSLGCFWDDGSKKCRSREMSDWSWFSRHTYLVSLRLPLVVLGLHRRGAWCRQSRGSHAISLACIMRPSLRPPSMGPGPLALTC